MPRPAPASKSRRPQAAPKAPKAKPSPSPRKSQKSAPAQAKKATKPAAKPASKKAPGPTKAPPPAAKKPLRNRDVDPLLARDAPPVRLVGGLDRDAQLPTSLVPKPDLPAAVPLQVQVQATAGNGQHGNTQPANLLVVVTCGGWPVPDLNIDHFSVMQHFDQPGQTAPFSNNIVSFRNAGSGAYLLQVRPLGSAPWQAGQYLAQIIVSSPDERHGQSTAKIIIR
ncbi:MAG: hypothetical protein KDK99_16115 [Verrucomicrobiales bacterium]|nr:hypothetical protein [Verrucomicrobiales bacterium]